MCRTERTALDHFIKIREVQNCKGTWGCQLEHLGTLLFLKESSWSLISVDLGYKIFTALLVSHNRWKNEAETSTKERSKVNKPRNMNFNLSLRSPVMKPVVVQTQSASHHMNLLKLKYEDFLQYLK